MVKKIPNAQEELKFMDMVKYKEWDEALHFLLKEVTDLREEVYYLKNRIEELMEQTHEHH